MFIHDIIQAVNHPETLIEVEKAKGFEQQVFANGAGGIVHDHELKCRYALFSHSNGGV